MPDQPDTVVVFMLAVALFLGVLAVFLLAFLTVFRLWLQAFLSGTPVSVLQIVGMRLRRSDANTIIKMAIMASQAGVPVSCGQLEQAYLQGVDLQKVMLALVGAKRQGKEVSFEDLVDAELAGRLAEKLGQHSVSPSGTVAAERRAREDAGTSRDARICPKCAARVAGDTRICRNCGAVL